MGWIKKKFKSAAKIVKKTVKTVTSTVKSVAKAVVKVGKAVVKGVSSAVKGIGKTLGKLGPLATMAIMMIPGMQAFAAGMWSSMGITSVIGQNMMTGALTGFISSGGDLKGALMGAGMAGLGTAASGAFKGFQAGDTLGGLQNALTQQSSIQTFQGGLATAKAQWGSFTNKVGDFFSNQGNGNVANGAAKVTNAASTAPPNATIGDMQTELVKTPVPDVGYASAEEMAARAAQSNLNSIKVDQINDLAKMNVSPTVIQDTLSMSTNVAEQNELLRDLMVTAKENPAYSTLSQTGTYAGPDITQTDAIGRATGTSLQTGTQMTDPYWQVANDYNVVPGSSQHLKLLEQDYPGYTSSGGKFTFDSDLSFWEPEARSIVKGAYAAGTPTYISQTPSLLDKVKSNLPGAVGSALKGLSGMFGQDAGTAGYAGAFDTSSGGYKATPLLASGGTGGQLGYSETVRQLQGTLVSQSEQAAEEARRRAAKGWQA
jgi:hypothetical protein